MFGSMFTKEDTKFDASYKNCSKDELIRMINVLQADVREYHELLRKAVGCSVLFLVMLIVSLFISYAGVCL